MQGRFLGSPMLRWNQICFQLFLRLVRKILLFGELFFNCFNCLVQLEIGNEQNKNRCQRMVYTRYSLHCGHVWKNTIFGTEVYVTKFSLIYQVLLDKVISISVFLGQSWSYNTSSILHSFAVRNCAIRWIFHVDHKFKTFQVLMPHLFILLCLAKSLLRLQEWKY